MVETEVSGRRRIRVWALLGVAVLAGVALVAGWFVVGDGEWAAARCAAQVDDEGGSVEVLGWSWSPLGTRCRATDVDGTSRVFVVDPW